MIEDRIKKHERWLNNEDDGEKLILANEDLHGIKIKDANLTGAYLEGVDFSGAKFVNVNFTEAYMVGANFKKATGINVNFSYANLEDFGRIFKRIKKGILSWT